MARGSRVLLVDDDYDDRQLFASALQKSGLNVDLFEATDGAAAIDYLLGKRLYADRAKFPYPDLIFLDLKMPQMDGFAVLKAIRISMGLQNLPVIVFTNQDLGSHATDAYHSQASAIHQKPFKHDDLVGLLQRVIPSWLEPNSSPFHWRPRQTKGI